MELLDIISVGSEVKVLVSQRLKTQHFWSETSLIWTDKVAIIKDTGNGLMAGGSFSSRAVEKNACINITSATKLMKTHWAPATSLTYYVFVWLSLPLFVSVLLSLSLPLTPSLVLSKLQTFCCFYWHGCRAEKTGGGRDEAMDGGGFYESSWIKRAAAEKCVRTHVHTHSGAQKREELANKPT